MNSYKKYFVGAKTGFAALLFGLSLAPGAHALVPDPHCVATCQQVRRAGVIECVSDGNCVMGYKLDRATCVAATVPGPERKSCFLKARAELSSCKLTVAACKTNCNTDFQTCRDDCASGN